MVFSLSLYLSTYWMDYLYKLRVLGTATYASFIQMLPPPPPPKNIYLDAFFVKSI
jgi:hypothetical protein